MAKSFPNTGATVIDSAADLPAASAALEGILMFQKDTNELKICDGSSWVSVINTDNTPMDAWSSWTPTAFTQSTNITATYNNAYKKIGKLVFVRFQASISAGGTANNNIFVTVPSALAMASGVPAYYMVGVGSYYNGSRYPFFVMNNSSTTVLRFKPVTNTVDGILGTDSFTGALTSGQLDFTAVWQGV